jgi:NDP-sugar pyrophosphorylase family protein
MGTVKNYLSLHRDLLNGHAPYTAYASPQKGINTHVDPTAILEGPIILGDETRIEANVKLVGPLSLGARCIIRENAVLESSVLWDDVDVGSGSIVRDSVIGSGMTLKADASILGETSVKSS